MKNAKRWGVMLMVLSFLVSLFGCAEQTDYNPWNGISMNKTSSVRTEAYHFNISTGEEGDLMIRGYCYDGETEYRVEEDAYLSGKASSALRLMELENAPTQKEKKGIFGRQVMDGTQITVTLSGIDGTERKITLPAEQLQELEILLKAELKRIIQSAGYGPWQELWFDGQGSAVEDFFSFEVTQESGEYLVSGYCSADGEKYESEDGIPVSDDVIGAIRELELEALAASLPGEEPLIADSGAEMLDGSGSGLKLIFAEGQMEEKELQGDRAIRLKEILTQVFCEKAEVVSWEDQE